MIRRRTVLHLAGAAAAAAAAARPSAARAQGAPLKELRLDYAYYSPTSLVPRKARR